MLAKQETILAKEEIFWRPKSREKWLDDEDWNTKFFHHSTILNREKIKIVKIKDTSDTITEDLVKISKILVNHFQNILNNYDYSNKIVQTCMLEVIHRIATKDDNRKLNKHFSLEEVRLAFFDSHLDKSLGLDDFHTFFYQKCWDILGEDLWKAIEASRNGGSFFSEINHTFLTLIPKKEELDYLGNFRPISLSNTIYKIFAKILVNKLKYLLPKIIFENKISFVQGRSILDGILIIQEMIHSTIKNKSARIFMKLDSQKEYNMVDWRILCKTLEALGFSCQWINLIFQCISTTKIWVLVNGTPEGFFNTLRGIR